MTCTNNDGSIVINNTKISTGDLIRTECNDIEHTGILMPGYGHGNSNNIVIKLKNGYNIGICIDTIRKMTVVRSIKIKDTASNNKYHNISLPKILLLSTGGTISSKIDYVTGGVVPTLSAQEINESIPDLAGIADIYTDIVFLEASENFLPMHWKQIAEKINSSNYKSYKGIIISHGTDTMHYTAAYLSFALSGFPIPIALVGSQRSFDRPSSDAVINLISAVKLIIKVNINGVFVVMHNDENDDIVACHIGTRVRKNHTSKRGAFKTIGNEPAFLIQGNRIIKNISDIVSQEQYNPKLNFDSRVVLVKYYPGYDNRFIDNIMDYNYKAIIFEGTGLGHIGKIMYKSIKKANKKGLFLGMTSQCINGNVQMDVYESGRKLKELGVISLHGIIPETALVKAMWALGNTKNIKEMKKLMLKNIASEF